MILRVLGACQLQKEMEFRVVLGPHLKLIENLLQPLGPKICIQAQPLGTGNAVGSADLNTLEGDVLITNGDHPLLSTRELQKLYGEFLEQKLDFAVVSAELEDPGSFGRIVRHQGRLRAIVEAKEASSETLKIREVNTGIYFATSEFLQTWIPKLQNRNSKGEYYVTDLVELGLDGDEKLDALKGSKNLAFGVNTQKELAKASQICFRRKAEALMESGVMLLDPLQVYIEDTAQVEAGAVIWPQVYLRGQTSVQAFAAIENNCVLIDAQVGKSVVIKANSYIEKTKIGDHASIGPFARLRPETEIGAEAHVGNFVEMKKVKFGAKSKAGHLTYLGDAQVGEETNIGCGTITCNYAVDKKKYETKIGKGVFVGSDTQFVAPVEVGDGAVIASGSTITADVPPKALAIARARQENKTDWNRES